MSHFSMVEVLENESVRSYFISIFSSDLSSERKYDRFVQFFKIKEEGLHRERRTQPRKLEDILKKTNDSIFQYVQYLKRCQKKSGGWGFQYRSNFWETTHALLFLWELEMSQNHRFDIDETIMHDGIRWIEIYFKRHWNSAVDENGVVTLTIKVYDISLFIILVFKMGIQDRFNIWKYINPLLMSQNMGWGWEITSLKKGELSKGKNAIDVGATSLALKALAEVYASENCKKKTKQKIKKSIGKGIEWLIAMQNHEGSWSDGSCYAGDKKLGGQPLVTKTCDALQGVFVGGTIGINVMALHRDPIKKAVDWLKRKEKPLLNTQGKIYGWGWSEDNLEATCLTVETLINIHGQSPLVLLANVEWLLKKQIKNSSNPLHGAWSKGLTSRIALSLLRFNRKVKGLL